MDIKRDMTTKEITEMLTEDSEILGKSMINIINSNYVIKNKYSPISIKEMDKLLIIFESVFKSCFLLINDGDEENLEKNITAMKELFLEFGRIVTWAREAEVEAKKESKKKKVVLN